MASITAFSLALVERYAQLGTVCLNVGCIPSKALLHVAAVMDEVSHLGALGIDFGAPKVNVDMLHGHKEKVITKAHRRPGRHGQDAQGRSSAPIVIWSRFGRR